LLIAQEHELVEPNISQQGEAQQSPALSRYRFTALTVSNIMSGAWRAHDLIARAYVLISTYRRSAAYLPRSVKTPAFIVR
jgi:hypothetical protein